MSIKKQLGNRIKELRLKVSLTQEELSERVDISPKSLSQIELGNNFISADTLEKLCNALEVNPKYLFDFDYINLDKKDALAEIEYRLKHNSKLLEVVYKIVIALDS